MHRQNLRREARAGHRHKQERSYQTAKGSGCDVQAGADGAPDEEPASADPQAPSRSRQIGGAYGAHSPPQARSVRSQEAGEGLCDAPEASAGHLLSLLCGRRFTLVLLVSHSLHRPEHTRVRTPGRRHRGGGGAPGVRLAPKESRRARPDPGGQPRRDVRRGGLRDARRAQAVLLPAALGRGAQRRQAACAARAAAGCCHRRVGVQRHDRRCRPQGAI
mmetsp:Transcript_29026/g.48710  ORF Transcript_29026/g.48710 Transcript_29026/m.48710 type:complete len:218 (+) Transcript_29026:1654-2307(+)